MVAAAVLYAIATGKSGFDVAASGFASNGYGAHSPGGSSMHAVMVSEFVLTALVEADWEGERPPRFKSPRSGMAAGQRRSDPVLASIREAG
jgi:aquaporin Z